MTLNFMQRFPDGTPTNFVTKITYGLSVHEERCTTCAICDCFRNYSRDKKVEKFLSDNYPNYFFNDTVWKDWDKCGHPPKLHTIRSGDRWKEGTSIHFKIWAGKPYIDKTFNFAPILPCISVQEIQIDRTYFKGAKIVIIDGRILEKKEIKKLAINDGLDGIDGFFKWFDKDFKGQIIHWTDLKY